MIFIVSSDMNKSRPNAGKHLTHDIVQHIVSGPMLLKDDIDYFNHWRTCPECRNKLLLEMPTAGFIQPAPGQQTVQISSLFSTLTYHFAGNGSTVLAASFTIEGLQKTIGRDLKINIDAGASEFQMNLSGQIDTCFRSGIPFHRPRINPTFIKTPFMLQVLFWTWLIPFGQIVTYGDIARWTDRPGASRAVGRALHNNPVPVFIPCHRVIGKSGNLTGFSEGLGLKKQLLRMEGHGKEQ